MLFWRLRSHASHITMYWLESRDYILLLLTTSSSWHPVIRMTCLYIINKSWSTCNWLVEMYMWLESLTRLPISRKHKTNTEKRGNTHQMYKAYPFPVSFKLNWNPCWESNATKDQRDISNNNLHLEHRFQANHCTIHLCLTFETTDETRLASITHEYWVCPSNDTFICQVRYYNLDSTT